MPRQNRYYRGRQVLESGVDANRIYTFQSERKGRHERMLELRVLPDEEQGILRILRLGSSEEVSKYQSVRVSERQSLHSAESIAHSGFARQKLRS